jgi:Selenocysteine synthase N terminal
LNELLRSLPQTSALLESEPARRLVEQYSREEVLGVVREELQAIRDRLLRGSLAAPPDFTGPDFFAGLAATIDTRRRHSLRFTPISVAPAWRPKRSRRSRISAGLIRISNWTWKPVNEDHAMITSRR